MALTVKTVSVSEVTRFVSDGPSGLITADVTIDLEDVEAGLNPLVTVEVDLPDADGLSFSEIETRSIIVAIDVLKAVSSLDAADLERSFRAKFANQSDESPAS